MIKTLTLLAAAAAVFAAPASAESLSADIVQTEVSYADLNLSSVAGRATLEGRVRGAVRSVCGSIQGPSTAEHERHQKCRSSALAGANAQVDEVLARQGSVTVLAARR